MLDRFLADVGKICAQIPSFGEVLDSVRETRNLTQKDLSGKLSCSEAEVSRLVNNQIPKNLKVSDIDNIAKSLDCTQVELVKLVEAFTCYMLSDRGLIDLDDF